jgi:parvulin-like peptidyl-prolyl isomerase
MRFATAAALSMLSMLSMVALISVQNARAEVIEEIVAYVDSDIITKTDLDNEEQLLVQETYRQFAGQELDRTLKERREGLLQALIDQKILLHRAERQYDVARMGEAYLEGFQRQQDMTDAEFQQVLADDNMTEEDLTEKLIEALAPADVKRIEVGGRISVGDKEVEAFYVEYPNRFTVPGEVTVREIVLLADSEKAKASRREEVDVVMQRLSTEEFAAVAEDVSEAGTAGEGGLLGPLARGELSDQLELAAFSQPVGESAILETPYGFHLLKVDSRTDDRVETLDEVREKIRSFLENEKYVAKLNEFMERARTESKWCVREKYMDRLPPLAPRRPCEQL